MIRSFGLIRSPRIIAEIKNKLSNFSQHTLQKQNQELASSRPEFITEDTNLAKKSFAQMFKESKFVALGDLENKYLVGKIVDIVGDDLYIDYGGKFNCVVKRPEKGASYYQRNKNVKIKLISFEMASYFLNAAKHITLLESDAELIGLLKREEDQDENSKLFKKEIDELNLEPYY